MVILRRDIAAAQPESIFFKKNSKLDLLTDYDLFMQEKRDSLFNFEKEIEQETSMNAVVNETESWEDMRLNNRSRSDDSYTNYMKNQLHRNFPEQILSEEEFYNSNYHVSQEQVAKVKEGRKKLTKQGKIFTLVYFFAVIAIALIMLLAYGNFGPVIVNAESSMENVEPLEEQRQENETETNWFDKLIDTFH